MPTLHLADPEDLPFLRDMLVEAAFPPGTDRPPDPLADDHVSRYLDGWGRPDDLALVAWWRRETVGAVWMRRMPPDRPGYGFVDAATPELTLAVADGARGRGISRALMIGALDLAAACGHERTSLSVAMANLPAAGLYRSLGFADVAPDGTSMTMLAGTAPAPPPPEAVPLDGRITHTGDAPALVRLRAVMFRELEATPSIGWLGPLVSQWPEMLRDGRWVGALVDGPDGRPVASALATVHRSVPGPGRPTGRTAHIGSVATEPAWRRRGAARAAVATLLNHLDEIGIESTTLNASPDGAALYRSLGFAENDTLAMRRPRS